MTKQSFGSHGCSNDGGYKEKQRCLDKGKRLFSQVSTWKCGKEVNEAPCIIKIIRKNKLI